MSGEEIQIPPEDVTDLSETKPARRKYKPRVKTTDEQRLAKAKADKAEFEVKILMGEFVAADEVEAEWKKLLLAFRAKILSIPSQVAPDIVDMESINEVEHYLKKSLAETLTELVKEEKLKVDVGL